MRSDITAAQLNNVYPLTLYAGNGAGNFTEQTITIPGIDDNSPFRNGLQMAGGDFNNDGKTELVFNLNDRLSVYSYGNTGNWSEIYRDGSDFETRRNNFTIGDINNDSKLDIVTAGSGKIELLIGQGNGSFQSQVSNRSDNGFNGISKLKIADANGDLQPDLVMIDYYNSVETYSLDSNSQLSQLELSVRVQPASKYLGMADVDRNGSLDLLWDIGSAAAIGITKDYYRFAQAYATSYTLPASYSNNSSSYNSTSFRNTSTKSYTYDSVFNQLTSVTDELGRKTLYDLDTNTGNVLKTTRIVGLLDSTINGETNDVVTSYTYTSTGQVDTVTDALLHITDYDYDLRGNLTKTTSAKGTLDQTIEQYEYDLAGNRTASIDALERKTKYVYNSTNMLLQTIDPLGGITTYNYDKMGHQTRVIDALGQETKMTYDSRGRLISTLAANDATITNSYDNNGNLIEVRRQKSTLRSEDIVTKYQYDARNRLIGTIAADGGITAAIYDLNNSLAIATDTLGQTTKKFYDSRNRLVRELDGLNNETKYSYDAANQLTETTDAKGNITDYFYDQLGRQTAKFRALTQSVSTRTFYETFSNSYGSQSEDIPIPVTTANGFATHINYDKLGNVIATFDANGNRTEYKYDALNRLIQTIDVQGKTSTISYNKVGNILSVTDALNRTTNYGYDDLDRQTSRTDALNQTTTTTYNKVGNILTINSPIAGQTTSYGYDKLNRKTSTTDALGQTRSVVYNILGNITSTTDELGRTTSYEYDKVDRLTTTTDPLLHTTSTSYDTEGNSISTTDAKGNQTSYLYDALNRRIQVTDAKLGTTKTGYDAVGGKRRIGRK